MSNALTATALWGDLFQDKIVQRAFAAEVFLDHLLAFERAWTQALSATGQAGKAQEAAALQALDVFAPNWEAIGAAATRDGMAVPGLVAQIKAALHEDVAAAIHVGATSQDVIDTAMMLAARTLLADFEQRVSSLLTLLDKLSEAHGHKSLMARTRMQTALPITVADRLGAWRAPLARAQSEIAALHGGLPLQIGGPVGTRDMAEAEAMVAHIARTLGLNPAPVWHSERSVMLDIGQLLVKLSGALGKLGQDICLMAQNERGEVTLSGAGGSSAMAHKQNPVRAEALVALAHSVATQNGGLGRAMVHEQERSGVAWAVEWLTLPAMFEMTGAALGNAQALVAQITNIGSPEPQ